MKKKNQFAIWTDLDLSTARTIAIDRFRNLGVSHFIVRDGDTFTVTTRIPKRGTFWDHNLVRHDL